MEVDILSSIKFGETECLEFKTSFGREAVETLSAFANTKGGSVIIGIGDDGKIIGVQAGQESVQQWVNQIKNSTAPAIVPDAEIHIRQGKTVVVLSVISYPIKPISFKGKYFKRVRNSNHLMDLNEIANEHLKTMNLSWDFSPDVGHKISDISLEKVNRFIEMFNQYRDYPIVDDPYDCSS